MIWVLSVSVSAGPQICRDVDIYAVKLRISLIFLHFSSSEEVVLVAEISGGSEYVFVGI